MRYIKYMILGAIGLALLIMALANRQLVTLQLASPELAGLFGLTPEQISLSLPMYAVVFAAVGLGLLIGFLWEWVREHKHRSQASLKEREARKLQREVARLKDEKHEGQDEVLALLDKAS
ncbi:LapA family protein [Alphaproteobacteria bacterium KMM 3653]|uniref:LapA family protein n=1 Tax=Harenicola maris TaxID=2841044 RepID=A0AAP2CR18_9RHOB|nr:LapA family protein [Harenicola maris]